MSCGEAASLRERHRVLLTSLPQNLPRLGAIVITAEISSDAMSPYSLASHAIRAKCKTM
jgi:hypothetical protein